MAVYTKYTRLINVCTAIRAKGVRVDIRAAYEARNLIRSKLIDLEKELFSNYGYVNYQSPLQMRSWSATLGLDPYMKDGKRSYGKEFRDMHKGQPVIDLLEEAMKYSKCQSFTDIILNHERNGRVYPSLVIMQAKTGRFACTSPNIQQIPARDPILGPLLRGVFIPDEGESWYALDFSAQEPRLQIHYASKLELNSAIQLARKYIEDPNMDSHQAVCDMVNANSSEKITRKQAKTINLGLSYGMGKAKLAASLGVTEDEAVKLKNTYNKCAPFLDKLSKACQNAVKSRGCIKTIGGRSVVVDEGFEYKALNALIQGSAFDQIAEAMLQLYDRNIIPLMCVHDELDFSCDDQTARVAKEIMETCIPMEVPSVAELNKGNNWGECK
jgi:DNA polymerase-1